jgi:hypothetical protein
MRYIFMFLFLIGCYEASGNNDQDLVYDSGDTGDTGDMDAEKICCDCECSMVVNPTWGTIEIRSAETSAVGLSCRPQCIALCGRWEWDFKTYSEVECSRPTDEQ